MDGTESHGDSSPVTEGVEKAAVRFLQCVQDVESTNRVIGEDHTFWQTGHSRGEVTAYARAAALCVLRALDRCEVSVAVGARLKAEVRPDAALAMKGIGETAARISFALGSYIGSAEQERVALAKELRDLLRR